MANRSLTSGNTTNGVDTMLLNGFAHRNEIVGSQNRCVLPPDVMCLLHFLKGQFMMFSKRQIILTTIIIVDLLFVVCTSTLISQTGSSVDSTAIDLQFSHFQQALLARDTTSIGDFYTDDAVSLLQNQPPMRVRNSIVQRCKKTLANPFIFRTTSAEINVSSSGQDAFQFGTFQIHSSDTTNVLLASGKVMFLWKKRLDRWRIALEMDNFNAMAPQKSSNQTKQ